MLLHLAYMLFCCPERSNHCAETYLSSELKFSVFVGLSLSLSLSLYIYIYIESDFAFSFEL